MHEGQTNGSFQESWDTMKAWVGEMVIVVLCGAAGAAAQNRVLVVEGGTLIDCDVHLRECQLPVFLSYGITAIADIHHDTA